MGNKLRLLIMIFLVGPLSTAYALPPSALPENINIENTSLQRCSIAPVKALKFIKVGYASLYVNDCDVLTSGLESNLKQLSFEYYKAIPGDAFGKAATNFLVKNLPPEIFDQLEAKITEFNAAYKDIDKGDRYDLRRIPGKGISLYLNGELLSTETDEAFADAYFKIWFGERPFNKKLKSRLLSG